MFIIDLENLIKNKDESLESLDRMLKNKDEPQIDKFSN